MSYFERNCRVCGETSKQVRQCCQCRRYYCAANRRCGTPSGAWCSKCPPPDDVDADILAAVAWVEDALVEAYAGSFWFSYRDALIRLFGAGRLVEVDGDWPIAIALQRVDRGWALAAALQGLEAAGIAETNARCGWKLGRGVDVREVPDAVEPVIWS